MTDYYLSKGDIAKSREDPRYEELVEKFRRMSGLAK